MQRGAAVALSLLLGLPYVSAARADEPKEAGKDVPAPHRVKLVQPKYPADALARGERAIVVLEIVVDESGKVADAKVLHGTPEFGAAALEAARQWRYEVTRVSGHPVPVRLTVPLTFAARLPDMTRAQGIPELRHGASPVVPASDAQGGSVLARLEIDPEGRVADVSVQRGESPWTEALLSAVKTWRFAEPENGHGLAFEVHADFKTGHTSTIDLALTDPVTIERVANADAAAEPVKVANPSTIGGTGASTEVPVPGPAIATTGPTRGATRARDATDTTAPPQPTPPARGTAAATASPRPASRPAGTRAPVEVIRGAQPAPLAASSAPAAGLPIVENGGSSIRDVVLGPNLPDLVKGRRVVAPPLVRMSGAYGDVVVRFSIDSGGVTSLTGTDGPDALKEAAESVVKSWVFRRALPNRVYAVARLHYAADGSSAKVDASE